MDGLNPKPPLPPMEAKLVDALPAEDGWQYEPKWDGFRCLVFRDGEEVVLQSKAERPLGRFFPEVVEQVRRLSPTRFVLDGELIVPVGDVLSFDALQQRLHPAESRINKLSRDTPAQLMLFDLLGCEEESLAAVPLRERRAALERFHQAHGSPDLLLSPATRSLEVAQGWLRAAGSALDGVMAKRLDAPYRPGERAMLKVKQLRTADCVVGGFRYLQNKAGVGSLLLGLYNDQGLLDHIGFTSNLPGGEAREALTRELEAMIEAPGFTGRAPGGPSRWATGRSTQWQPVRPERVVEVRYDQVTGGRLRHGAAFLRWRPDKSPRQCGQEQLQHPLRPAALAVDLEAGG